MIVNATLCYLQTPTHTLMLLRNRKKADIHQDKWNGLGGKLEARETPEECAIREVREESGLQATRLIFKGILTFPLFDGKNDWIVFVYIIPEFTGTLSDCSEGELHWIPTGKLNDLNLWEGDRVFLDWLTKPGFFSGKFVYKDGRLKEHSASFYP